MKSKLLSTFSFLASASLLAAAPLTSATAVHTKPETGATTITVLKAGTEPVPAIDAASITPAGWMAVELPGPFEGYVENKDLTKGLDVRAGAPIRLEPKADAGIIAFAEKDDKTTLTGLRGRWTQITLEKKLTGYIRVSGTATTASASAPAAPAPAPKPAPIAPAPVAPVAYGTAATGQPAPTVGLGDGGAASLPRQYAGRFVSTRRPLAPRRPYDWALNDDAGKRIAYIDASKILQTEQIEKYGDRQVVVYGALKPTNDGKDLVIQIESLQLK